MADSAANEAEAAGWAIRLSNGRLRAEDELALHEWLAADERRRGALLRAEATLAYLDRGRALAPAVTATTESAPEVRSRRAFLIGGGTVAGLAAAGVAGMVLTRPRATELRTAVGEIRRVPLADGSVASINTASALVVRMAEKRRDVMLARGEAFFEVARDRSRPFVVRAGRTRVEAVGTAFSVRRGKTGTGVIVTEGVVKVWIEGKAAPAVRIAAGSRGFVEEASPVIAAMPATDAEDRALAWRSGDIVLDGESLDYAVAEINRYNTRQLVIDSPALGRQPLVGYFRVDQPEAFSEAIAATLGATVVRTGSTIHLSN